MNITIIVPTLQPVTFLCPVCAIHHTGWSGRLPNGLEFRSVEGIGAAQRQFEGLYRRIYIVEKAKEN